jgi:epoxyqueuosine reductase
MLNAEIKTLFEKEHIAHVSHLPFSACHVTKAHLYEKQAFLPQSVLIFLIPYFSVTPENFSSYAAAEDYHLYFEALSARLCAELKALYPEEGFIGFADHSPIDERDAAVRAGLGIYGKNKLLISKEYGTYQFIGEILSTVSPERLGEVKEFPFSLCIGCNACLLACPTGFLRGEGASCLSAITQKKGTLSNEEVALMKKSGTAWGCDECQKVCPYTKEAIHRGSVNSPIPFFNESLITHLTSESVSSLSDEAFACRAFAWRGRETLLRNVRILEEK